MSNQVKKTYAVRCHCGILRANVNVSNEELVAWKCNCSDCWMRGNVHVIISENDFCLDLNEGSKLEDLTILYEWGTKTAKRRFCRNCGILPWYHTRSKPHGLAITLNCIDWSSCVGIEKPRIRLEHFDGTNWEESFHASKIKDESK